MEQTFFDRCQQLISHRMGFHIREQDAALLRKTLDNRVQARRLTHAGYLALLEGANGSSEEEWKQLFILLTNQESYFFRDEGQFRLLRERILPELIERNAGSRSLRIWSAGCSTGEEPYSLAIMIDRLLPAHQTWNVFLLGTDLSEAALEQARRGTYSPWSFRNVPQTLRDEYFDTRENQFALRPDIRRMVTFRQSNLIMDNFPAPSQSANGLGIAEMDLIVCRNVFIYFKRDAVAKVVDKFTRSLREDGYLLTGHTEIHDVILEGLKPQSFPESVIFRRTVQKSSSSTESPNRLSSGIVAPLLAPPAGRTAAPQPARSNSRSSGTTTLAARRPATSTPVPASAPTSVSTTSNALAANDDRAIIDEALLLLRSSHARESLQRLEKLVDKTPADYAMQCVAAQALANMGRYDEARQCCQKAQETEPFAALPYHILARIEEEVGNSGVAKELLKKVIYLAPDVVTTYVELAALYAHENDPNRARTMREAALKLVSTCPADAAVPVHAFSADAPPVAAELRGHLLQELGRTA